MGGGTQEGMPPTGKPFPLSSQQNERGGPILIKRKGVAERSRVAGCSARSHWDSKQRAVLDLIDYHQRAASWSFD